CERPGDAMASDAPASGRTRKGGNCRMTLPSSASFVQAPPVRTLSDHDPTLRGRWHRTLLPRRSIGGAPHRDVHQSPHSGGGAPGTHMWAMRVRGSGARVLVAELLRTDRGTRIGPHPAG